MQKIIIIFPFFFPFLYYWLKKYIDFETTKRFSKSVQEVNIIFFNFNSSVFFFTKQIKNSQTLEKMFNNTFLRRFTQPVTSRVSKSLLVSSCSSASVLPTQQQQQSSSLLFNAIRFNTTDAAAASDNTSSNNNRRSGNYNNNNNRNNNSNNRSFQNNNRNNNYNSREQQLARTIGTVEFYDVRDTPKDGREMRLTFRKDAQRDSHFLSITIRPQLGPRKTDPHDPTPQFDQQNRLSLRLKPKEISTLLFWLEGRQQQQAANNSNSGAVEVSGQSYKISLARQDSGVVVCTIAGVKLDGTMSDPLSYELQPHQQIQFKAFLENSLYGIWGLPSF